MKKILLVAILFTLSMGTTLKAQRNVIKANIFSPLVKTGSFFYERGLNDNSSLQLGMYFTAFSAGNVKWRGFGITPEYRYYPSGNGVNGFYLAPFLRYQSITISEEFSNDYTTFDSNGNISTVSLTEESSATLSTFGGGFLIGRQWIFGEHISLDSFIGPCYNVGSASAKSNSNETYDSGSFAGFGVRFGLTVGFAF